ncbi:zinc finger containing protein [Pseudozyma hubeiensis SY62]|uniref:Zinc finger containing protein n=1 Tax=Pseudozyma hubeiensis (strain SY62) TaxID=1305764 RepID=R9P892_PSEHS|nr:zinc finger containing protein [Pseudozyma hubeiensis SY62]GAC97559.1 zinc finger containing protein [Pseudozyma hubeiensis SY62]
MSTNAEPATAVAEPPPQTIVADGNTTTNTQRPAQHERPSLTEALTLRRNLLKSLWIGMRQLPRGRRIILTIRLAVSFAQIIAFIPVLALPGSRRVSPSHETGRVCDPDSLFNYLVVHIIRLALDIPVELYLGLSPHRTRRGRRASPEARAIAERDRPLGSEYLDMKVGKISTLLGIASLVIFVVGNAIVYSSTECSHKPAEAVALFWTALASLIVVYIFIFEIAVLAFLIVCALPLLIMVMRALGLTHRLPQRELHPETGKIDQMEVDKRVKLVYYTPAEEEDAVDGVITEQTAGADQQNVEECEETAQQQGESRPSRPAMDSRQSTQQSTQATSRTIWGNVSRLTRLLIARRRSETSATRLSGGLKPVTPANHTVTSPTSTPQTETGATASTSPNLTASRRGKKLKYPLHPLPAHRATCPICLCDFEEPSPDEEPEPEPLRLLECGHVMHRGCVDQWLTTVSGRCPVCQKAVIPEMEKAGEQQAVTVQDAGREGVAQPEVMEEQTGSGEAAPAAEAPVDGPAVQEASGAGASVPARDAAEVSVDGEAHELQPLPSSASTAAQLTPVNHVSPP